MSDFSARDVDDTDEAVGSTTMLSDLRAELKVEVKKPPLTLPVPGRPGYEIRMNPNVDFRRIQAIAKSCYDKKLEDTDRAKFAATILLTYTEAVLRHGEEVLDDDGHLLTLSSPVWMEIYGAVDRVSALKKFFGEADIVIASDRFAKVAGVSVDPEAGKEPEADPLL